MNRKTLTALGVFAVLGALALVALRAPEKGERTADRPHPLQPINAADVTTLEITKDGKATTIKNEGGKYRIVAPVAYAADDLAAKAAFDGLGKLDVTDLVTEQPSKQSEFQVDDKSGIRILAKHDDKVVADLIVGKTEGTGTMVRLGGKNETWQASGIARYVFDKPPADWRDKSLTTFAIADAQKLDVVAKDGSKIALKRTDKKAGNEDKWDVVSSTVKIDKLDDSVPNGIVSAMSTWKTNDFADDVKPAAVGLEPPALTVTVRLKNNQSVSVLIGNNKADDETYVKKADAPQVFLVKNYNLDRVNKRPIEFRDKTLCDLAAADLAEVAVSAGDKSYTLTKSDGAWKAAKPAKLDVDGGKVNPIESSFKDWKATSFAEDATLKTAGLVKPKAIITAKGKGKPGVACTVKVGDETKDKVSYFVSTGKGADIYVAPKWSIDRILVKPDDLKKAATASNAPTKPSGRPGLAKR
jgi:uncharacterized protein DUF4340